MWLAEQTSLLPLRLLSYTLFLRKLFFVITELPESFSFGSVPHNTSTWLFFSLSHELASLQMYAHSSTHQWWSSRPSRQPG